VRRRSYVYRDLWSFFCVQEVLQPPSPLRNFEISRSGIECADNDSPSGHFDVSSTFRRFYSLHHCSGTSISLDLGSGDLDTVDESVRTT